MKEKWREGDVAAVYASPDRFSDLPFHLARRVMVVGSDHGTLKEELEEPQHADDVKRWFPDAGEFVRLFLSRKGRIFCLLEEKNLGSLQHLGLDDYKVIQRGGGRVLISNEI